MLCFFFFKQKTAYEMRISDWSSDVCSSDLVAHHVGKPALAEQQQDDDAENEPVPDAQTTHLKISLCRPYKGGPRRMHTAPSKKALNFFAVVDQIKLVHRRLESEVDRIEQPGGAQILDSRQILAGSKDKRLQKEIGGLETGGRTGGERR